MTKSYKILNLRVENVKRVQVVDITPGANMVTIAGDNGMGKSSVLDSIEMLFRGGDAIPGKPIRTGEESALIMGDLGPLKIKRTFTPKGTYLVVEAEDGARYQKPQDMLDGFLGAIAFDPLEFTRLDPKKQFEVIRGMVKIGVDIDALDGLTAADEENRKLAKRELATLEGQFKGLSAPAEDAPTQPIDIAAVAKELADTRELRAKGTVILRDIETQKAKVLDLEQQIEVERIHLGTLEKAWEKLKPDVPTKETLAEVENELAGAEAVNQKVAAAQAYATKKHAVEVKTKEVDALTDKIEKRRQQKADAIAAAKMPIKGLSLTDGEVTYNGLPLNQASGTEQIRVSTAIAMASNPTLRVIRIKDASVIDDKGMTMLKKMAEENDFQIFVEVISSKDPMAVIIEDGMVKGAQIEEAPKRAKKGA